MSPQGRPEGESGPERAARRVVRSAGTRRGALVWFRRDLRDYDHHALARALAAGPPVYAAFVFDRDILDALPAPADRRVEFI